jgi:hypothetical protein
MDEVTLAYCAGIVDGEGCIRVKRVDWRKRNADMQSPAFHASVTVRMVERDALDVLASIAGVSVRPLRAQWKNRRPLYEVTVSDAKAERLVRALLPYLRVKRAQAENVLALRELQSRGREHRTRVVGTRLFPNQHGAVRVVETRAFSEEYVAQLDALYERSRELNAVGVTRPPGV